MKRRDHVLAEDAGFSKTTGRRAEVCVVGGMLIKATSFLAWLSKIKK